MKIFETIDKTNRKIYLTGERLKHILRHPNMINKLDRIKETLIQPIKITALEENSKICFYFRYYKELKQYLTIMVKYLNGKGFIITAYYVCNLK